MVLRSDALSRSRFCPCRDTGPDAAAPSPPPSCVADWWCAVPSLPPLRVGSAHITSLSAAFCRHGGTPTCSVLLAGLETKCQEPHLPPHPTMAGETGGGGGGTGRDLPSGPINSISSVGPGGPIIYRKCFFFITLRLFFSNYNSCTGGFGPFETLGDPFPRGPQGLVPSTSGNLSPALHPTQFVTDPP